LNEGFLELHRTNVESDEEIEEYFTGKDIYDEQGNIRDEIREEFRQKKNLKDLF